MKVNFSLLGDLLLGPPNFDYKKNLIELPIWNEKEKESILNLSNDDIASEHYSTFGMTVFPFGHYYISEGRNFAGDHDDDVIALYDQEEFHYNDLSYGLGPTHLGTQLKFLQYCINSEKEHLARAFMGNQILSWIHSLNISLSETSGSLFPHLVNYIESTVLKYWHDLNGQDHLDEIHFYLRDFDFKADLLDNEKTSLKDIGEALMTPAYVGVFMSKPTLLNFASKIEIPSGFGTRIMMIETIFKEAVNYEKMPQLLSMFEAYFNHWESAYSDYAVKPVAKLWIEHIQQGKNIVEHLRKSL